MTDPHARLTQALADRYRLDRELGQGGMATVYLAHDVRHDRKVALKILRPELAAILGAERFLAEIKTTANLQHPHILPLHDSGQFDNGAGGQLVYYVMPYVEGESLRDRLTREHQLPIEDAVRITREIAGALDYAHRHGVIHRDIKPENILLHDGQAMVADFGIALAAAHTGGSRMTETGMSLGTPHYMSPEQAMGEREITAKSDVYALGCVAYEMLVGEPPFMGPNAQAIIARVMTETPRSLQLQRHTIPTHVEAAVRRALEKLPADRFQSAAEFATALGDPTYAARVTVERAAVGGAAEAGLRPARTAPAARTILTIATVMSLGLAAWGWLRHPGEVRRPERWVLAPLPGRDTIQLQRIMALSPDGTRLAYVDSAPGGRRQLYLRSLDQLTGVPLPGTDDAYFPTFAPDSRRLAFLAGDGNVRTVNVEGGSAQTVAQADTYSPLCWGDDGRIYFSRDLSKGGGISAVPERGGETETITTTDTARGEINHYCFAFVPGKRAIIMETGIAGGISNLDVRAYSLDRKTYSRLPASAAAQVSPDGRLLYVSPERQLRVVQLDLGTLTAAGEPVTLAENIFLNPDASTGILLSGTGLLIYAEQQPELSRLAWVTRGGMEQQIDTAERKALGPSIALSRDGRRFAATVSGDLWTYDLPGGPWTRLTNGGRGAIRPSWSPDGAHVSFIAERKSGIRAVFTVPADGGPEELIRQAEPAAIQDGEWSPDGRWFLYRQGPSGPTSRDLLYARPFTDSLAYPLAATTIDETSPRFSPDGRWVVYVANETGRDEVYVRPFPGPGRRLPVSAGGGTEPRWAHSGREIFYRDVAGNLVAVDVHTGPNLTVGGRRVLFDASRYLNDRNSTAYDVAPNDQRFLFVKPVEGGQIRWILLRNWPEEVARLR